MACSGLNHNPGELKFNADYNKKPLAYKFWSKYDYNYSKNVDDSKVQYYETQIEERHKYDVRCHSKMPRYTNQIYGWLPGYKLHFLQNCDSKIYKHAALQDVARKFITSPMKR